MTAKNPLAFCEEFHNLSEPDKEAVHIFVRERVEENVSPAEYIRLINAVSQSTEFLDEARRTQKLWEQSGESAKYVARVLNRQAAAQLRNTGLDNL